MTTYLQPPGMFCDRAGEKRADEEEAIERQVASDLSDPDVAEEWLMSSIDRFDDTKAAAQALARGDLHSFHNIFAHWVQAQTELRFEQKLRGFH
ncbi:hypothetical protein [Frateuria aurantia]|uniref:Uncharacterized protein n=1 Tax=Frateuria aurantia (strain ATCC 33424 / DSM 6220 / KCTC 2777 / LMG 1558 / NBRC 3245 / NCIMB 13370) TaxID=767434 RepID=H8L1U7_FRAAD|nr:hypothetical protein [Frateuria aurantia]AFC86358.1 hypothetical protein Fraau_1971 [Frateuria aurantia DSM 6220]